MARKFPHTGTLPDTDITPVTVTIERTGPEDDPPNAVKFRCVVKDSAGQVGADNVLLPTLEDGALDPVQFAKDKAGFARVVNAAVQAVVEKITEEVT